MRDSWIDALNLIRVRCFNLKRSKEFRNQHRALPQDTNRIRCCQRNCFLKYRNDSKGYTKAINFTVAISRTLIFEWKVDYLFALYMNSRRQIGFVRIATERKRQIKKAFMHIMDRQWARDSILAFMDFALCSAYMFGLRCWATMTAN